MTPENYRPAAVNFGGSAYLTRGANLTGASDTKSFVSSFWINPLDAATGSAQSIWEHESGGNPYTRIQVNQVGLIAVAVYNTSGSLIQSLVSSGTLSDGQWAHVLVAFDAAATTYRCYIDDANDSSADAVSNTTQDWTVGNFAIAAASSLRYTGDIADLMVWQGAYLDLSVEANRRMFISASGKPVNPDAPGGAIATLGTPIVRLSTAEPNWHVNAGSGGGFTENGTLTAAATNPAD